MELALVVARCELADCDRLLAPVAPGRPPRRFCSPEHRVKARARSRRGATPSAPPPRLDEVHLPVPVLAPLIGNGVVSRSPPDTGGTGERRERLALPAGSPAAPDRAPRPPAARPATRAPAPRRAQSRSVRRRRPAWQSRAARKSRRRRLGLVLGLLAVLVTGLGWVLFHDAAPAPPGADLPASDGRWIADAQQRVSAIDGVLDSITDAEAAYRRSGASDRPEPVARLVSAKTLLMQQRVLLQSQIDTLLQVAAVTGRITEIDGQLTALSTALDAAGTEPDDSTVDARAAVLEQQDLLQQRRAATVADLDRLRSAADTARSAPLPELDDTIPALIAEVTAPPR